MASLSREHGRACLARGGAFGFDLHRSTGTASPLPITVYPAGTLTLMVEVKRFVP